MNKGEWIAWVTRTEIAYRSPSGSIRIEAVKAPSKDRKEGKRGTSP